MGKLHLSAWEPGVALRQVFKELFPVEEAKEIEPSLSVDGVEFHYINIGSFWKPRFGGIQLKTADRNGRKVVRQIPLESRDTIDLGEVQNKFEELRDFHMQESALR